MVNGHSAHETGIITDDPYLAASRVMSLGCQHNLPSSSTLASSALRRLGCITQTMGFSSGMKTSNHVGLAPLILALLLLQLGTHCAASYGHVAASPRFKVANRFKDGRSITVLPLPGCCSPCGPNGPLKGTACPNYCVKCGEMVVSAGDVGMLDEHVGPFPPPYLMIQVEPGRVFCVDYGNLLALKPWDMIADGPNQCGPWSKGLYGHVSVGNGGYPICLYRCEIEK